jgi:hypothetical protein
VDDRSIEGGCINQEKKKQHQRTEGPPEGMLQRSQKPESGDEQHPEYKNERQENLGSSRRPGETNEGIVGGRTSFVGHC